MKDIVLKVRYVALLYLCVSSCFSQFYQFPGNFPQYYNFHVEDAFSKLNKKPLHGLNQKESDNFRMSSIYGLQQGIDENEIYLDWPLFEDYIQKVMDTIIPVFYREKYHFRLFVSRDPAVNAYANDNGFIFVNIGLLASIRSEAALAATIGHEAGHSIFDHGYNRYVDYILFKNNNPNKNFNSSQVRNNFSRNYEIMADTFAFDKMIKCGYNLNAVEKKFDIYERIQNRGIHTSLSAYTSGGANGLRNYIKNFSSHPVNEFRVKMAQKYASKVLKPGANYMVDSLTFHKLRRMAQEECKKILFEKSDYKECLQRAFIDYLYNEKNLKNLYYITESIRRLLYTNKELAKRGFLTEEYSDKEFVEMNYSILKKPELLFIDSTQEKELSSHLFFTEEIKPFNSYEEALYFFCKKAKELGLNEANFTLALYNYSLKKDDLFKVNLNDYIVGNSGVNLDFANALLTNSEPTLEGKKMLFIYDNSGVNAENNFWNGANYYQLKQKRMLQKEIKQQLSFDTLTTKFVFVSQLVGSKPKELYEFQKLEKALISLYNKEDKENYRKKRLSGKESMEERTLTQKYTKNIFIYAPEYYKVFKENDYGSLCFANISYDFDDALSTSELRNDYTTYYLNFNVMRPYFKTGIRGISAKKQADKEIAKEIDDFLYGRE